MYYFKYINNIPVLYLSHKSQKIVIVEHEKNITKNFIWILWGKNLYNLYIIYTIINLNP